MMLLEVYKVQTNPELLNNISIYNHDNDKKKVLLIEKKCFFRWNMITKPLNIQNMFRLTFIDQPDSDLHCSLMITHKFFHTFTFKHNQETIFMCNLSVFKAASIAVSTFDYQCFP